MTSDDNTHWNKIDRLFAEVVALPSGERQAFLERECDGDAELLNELQALLAADSRTELPMQSAVRHAADELLNEPTSTFLDRRIGNYQLVELLGAGGMGSVYLGRRVDEQFEHEVAIKLLPLGGANKAFIERFKSERQVLAGLDHPNIAGLLDGGETDDGLPYLVMEYVRGVPIDDYCDTNHLSILDRLRIFQDICRAVDYAHRNLVVHRDVKPSNILVNEESVPKLLDFGIAKVLDAGTAQPGLTQDGQRLMTPEYASPEQVRGEPVSTATDIYSLGVLLYRLLCGHSPYHVRNDLPSGLARAILEEVPSKPSTVITRPTDADHTIVDIPASRNSTLPRLRRRLQGDLDNIALTALRKEPERRYASANALLQDIDNYLSDKPITARAPSLNYRFGKFVRRNRIGVAATAAFVAVLLVSAVQVVQQRDRAEAEAATAERVSGFLLNMMQSSDPYERQGDVTARQLLDAGARQIDSDLAGEPLVSARLKTTMAKAYSSLGMQDTAAELASAAVALLDGRQNTSVDRANAYTTLSQINYEQQDDSAALEHAETALALLEHSERDVSALIADAGVAKSRALLRLDQSELARSAAEEAVLLLKTHLGENHADTNAAAANLSSVFNELGNYPRARELAEQVVRWTEQAYGADDLLVAEPLHSLGQIIWHQGDYRSANVIYERELSILEDKLGVNHPALHAVLVSLASNQRKIGYGRAAKAYYERAIQVLEDSESPPLGKLADTYGSLGTLIMDEGFLDEAEPLIRRALALNQEVHGEGNAENTFRLLHLGVLFRKREQHGEARVYLSQAVDAALSRYEDSHRNVQIMRLHLGVNELNAGNNAEARRILQGVLDSLLTHQGPDHPLVGQTLIELSGVDIADGRNEDAVRHLSRAMEIYQALRDDVHPDIELILRYRAMAYTNMNQPDEAARFTAEADQLRERREAVSAEEAQESQKSQF